ncbi:MAG: hypothetical protein EOP84_30420, partial [Verrucomicrobiaceae bacterium]
MAQDRAKFAELAIDRFVVIACDGLGNLDASGNATEALLSGDKRICLGPNDQDGGDKSYFGNLNLWTKQWWSPLPGKMDRDIAKHTCSLPKLRSVELPPIPAAPVVAPTHTDDEIVT